MTASAVGSDFDLNPQMSFETVNVLALQASNLDLPYIRRRCDQHNTRDLFEKLWLECKEFEQERTPREQ